MLRAVPRLSGLVALLCLIGCQPSNEADETAELRPEQPGNNPGGTTGLSDAGIAVTQDAGSPSPKDAGVGPIADAGSSGLPTGWLYTSGNHLYTSDGAIWAGRGANLPDTRSCNACTTQEPNVGEVLRRIDELVDHWKATFIRLTLESYATADGRVHWKGVLTDPGYLNDLKTIVAHVKKKPGVYMMISNWHDPSFSDLGWPTAATQEVWKKLAETFKNDSHVLFGLVNEPEQNYDGALNAQVWKAMNDTVAAIRSVEAANGTPNHIIAVQGTGGWSRHLSYYLTHPITAGAGKNIAYEVHVYDPASDFQERFITPAQTLPVIIGEFGPVAEVNMTLADCMTLMDKAKQLKIPHTAWMFHMRCAPDLIQDQSGGGCGVGMPLKATAFGDAVKAKLAVP